MEQLANVVIFITTSTEKEAHKIADVLLNQRKTACVNIVARVNSLFWWEDKIDSAQESFLIVKTKASLINEIVKIVKDNHSYDIPEIIALPVIGGNQAYLDWVNHEVR